MVLGSSRPGNMRSAKSLCEMCKSDQAADPVQLRESFRRFHFTKLPNSRRREARKLCTTPQRFHILAGATVRSVSTACFSRMLETDIGQCVLSLRRRPDGASCCLGFADGFADLRRQLRISGLTITHHMQLRLGWPVCRQHDADVVNWLVLARFMHHNHGR